MFSLEGKAAFITGAAGGIGLAVARRFIDAGAKVIITDIADASSIASQIGAHFLKLDVSCEVQMKAVLTEAESMVGKLDIVINNAGRTDIGFEFTETDGEFYDSITAVNQKGVFLGLKHAPAVMKDGGRIINTSSLAAFTKLTGTGVYSATKAAVISMTKMSALELAERQITVNAVCPAYVDTDGGNGEEGNIMADAFIPLGHVASVENIAGIFHFLASPEASFVTGQAITVDGGWSIGPTRNLMKKITGRDKTLGH